MIDIKPAYTAPDCADISFLLRFDCLIAASDTEDYSGGDNPDLTW